MNSMYRFECPINNENNKTIDCFSCLVSNDETVDCKERVFKGYSRLLQLSADDELEIFPAQLGGFTS